MWGRNGIHKYVSVVKFTDGGKIGRSFLLFFSLARQNVESRDI